MSDGSEADQNAALEDQLALEVGSMMSDVGSDKETGEGDQHVNTKKRVTAKNMTMGDYVDFAHRMMSVGPMQSWGDTEKKLLKIFACLRKPGGPSKAKKKKTKWGLKDTYQDYVANKVINYGRTIYGGKSDHEQKLIAFVDNLPDPQFLVNPAWKIQSFDPHLQTPVEILHVVLLGFIKYFWRDAMSHLNEGSKALLVTRLSSISVNGLGCSKLCGKTLVQYSGSLTGRDFCAIVHITPFVLYGLVPAECYDAWIALSTLVPLIWQPEINDLEKYLVSTNKSHMLRICAY